MNFESEDEKLGFNDNAMTFLCSLEILRDDLKVSLRSYDVDKSLRILREINRFSNQYIRILEGIA